MPQFNVAQLLKERIGATRSYTVDEPYRLESGELERVRGVVHFLRTDKGVYVSGRLDLGQWNTCARCLKRYRRRLSLPIEEEFFPTVDVNTGVFLPALAEAGEGVFLIDERHTLDLDEAIRQYFIVYTPMKPLCREDCPGLCPTCGTDRASGTCACQEARNPQWSALFKLLGQR